MNSVDMMHNLINRAKNLQEFIVTTDVPEDFRFNGVVPFNIIISEGIISATIYAMDFEEAATLLDNWLGNLK